MPKKLYDVGYGKPPVHSRFQPGQSGNKKGREKKLLNMSDIVLEELNELQTIEKDGNRIRIPLLRIMVKQFIRSAAKGNTRALLTIMELLEDGLSRKTMAEREAIRAKQPRPDLSKMTQDELTKLYFETLKKFDR
jgi:Family of unknown function (DUF5681)